MPVPTRSPVAVSSGIAESSGSLDLFHSQNTRTRAMYSRKSTYIKDHRVSVSAAHAVRDLITSNKATNMYIIMKSAVTLLVDFCMSVMT